ncbi:hypothetical protein D6821_01695 [Candidatus Parcubacteria bacterium]|nr:MAG: hypothetical protein D6821_01695 [Candidatus Parcubacteria bacterium]
MQNTTPTNPLSSSPRALAWFLGLGIFNLLLIKFLIDGKGWQNYLISSLGYSIFLLVIFIVDDFWISRLSSRRYQLLYLVSGLAWLAAIDLINWRNQVAFSLPAQLFVFALGGCVPTLGRVLIDAAGQEEAKLWFYEKLAAFYLGFIFIGALIYFMLQGNDLTGAALALFFNLFLNILLFIYLRLWQRKKAN